MKWPETVTLVRHDTSAYNELKQSRDADPLYQEFRKAFEADRCSPLTRHLAEELQSKRTVDYGDHNTPLANGSGHQAEAMATKLKDLIKLPDIIFYSPYDRTVETLERMKKGWPELAGVKSKKEERIREQEHGLALLYNDWRIFSALHPEQADLREIEGPYYYRYPQGECLPDVRTRLRLWNNTLIRDYAGKNVLAITHHLTILAYRANQENLDSDQFEEIDNNNKPINAGVTIYRGDPDQGEDGRLVLDRYNVQLY